MPDRSRLSPATPDPVSAAVSGPAPDAPAHLAPGGGNALQVGAIGSGLDDGLRAVPGGAEAYGHDPTQDGWFGGLFTMMDRLSAQAELADRFQIVEPGQSHGPNQVTREEFERIATLYSDVRMGNCNLRLGTDGLSEADAATFRAGAMNDLATMLTTEQGRGLLDDLAYQQVDGHDHTTTIGRSATAGEAGAYMRAGGSTGVDPNDASNGTGLSGGVNYIPGHTLDMARDLGNPNYARDAYAQNMTSDIVLFHELIHANRSRLGISEGTFDPSTGQFDRPSIPNSAARTRLDRGVAEEEYATVGLAGYGDTYTENNYRRERAAVTGTNIPQRTNYNGSGPARRR